MSDVNSAVILSTTLSGALVGFLLAVFGGGGSVLAAPLLLYFVGVRDPHIAIGTSSAAVAANAAINLLGHWRGGLVKWPCALTFGAAGLTGSFVGSTLAKMLPGNQLLLAFAVAMAAVGLSMFRRPKGLGDPDVHITPTLIARLAPMGFLTGLAAGFFGIGGGFLIVPGLMLATGMTMANATASSLVSVAIFGGATSINYAASGFVDFRLSGILLAGGLVGAVAGFAVAKFLASRALLAHRAFGGMVVLVALYVAGRALGVLSA